MTPQQKPLVIAHRGASGYRPEHSRAAYELAFALGADAVEPDIVATKDGVLVLRHENEISGTTDVARHPEFASRKTTKTIDGANLTGWFTEDFTWEELSTLRAVERLPKVRQSSATFDGRQGILRLTDLIGIIRAAQAHTERTLIMVAEIKHATYFASIGLPLDELFAAEIREWATADNLVVECFEKTVLGQIRERGIPGRLVYLVESAGSAADMRAQHGKKAPSYASQLTDAGLARLARTVDGVSFDKRMIIAGDGHEVTDVVERTHVAGLLAFTWTFRAENRFLAKRFRSSAVAADWGDWSGEFRMLVDAGLDGIFCDQPDLGVAVLKSRRSSI